jgi:hypothetical protein
MASDNKKAETGIAKKSEPPAKSDPVTKSEPVTKNKSTPAEVSPKAEGGETAAASSSYSRGEGQKPVTRIYKENWNAIFAKKGAKTKGAKTKGVKKKAKKKKR